MCVCIRPIIFQVSSAPVTVGTGLFSMESLESFPPI